MKLSFFSKGSPGTKRRNEGMSQERNDYRKWIEAGYRHYGKDPWFFIRELAQNSRDAGASYIKVRIGYSAQKEEVLTFEDDGNGMSFAEAGKYLFRLYASSKGGDKHSAGMFGIGFWTVLKFNPIQVIIQSRRRGQEGWGVRVQVGGELTTFEHACNLEHSGTRITLIRKPAAGNERNFFKLTHNALNRYCSFLRRNTRKADPLPVYFAGKNIGREMKIPGPVSLRFKNRRVEGAVGLGPKPRVELYARGLPVWQGTTLDELSHTPPEGSDNREFGKGLAPVFLLNGNLLAVNISRRKVIDNRHLQRVRREAEKALAGMVQSAADTVSPRNLIRRATDRFKSFFSTGSKSFLRYFLVLLLLIVPLELFLLKYVIKPRVSTSASVSVPVRALSLDALTVSYEGASVETIEAGSRTGFTYTPKNDMWLTLFYADKYHDRSGFLQADPLQGNPQQGSPQRGNPPDLPLPGDEESEFHVEDCTQNAVSLTLSGVASGAVFLPQPLGLRVVPASIRVDGRLGDDLNYRPTGEVVLNVPGGGTVTYRCCPAGQGYSSSVRETFLYLPETLLLPAGIEEQLPGHPDLREKVQRALQITASLFKYDDSPETARRYATEAGKGDWLNRVIAIGAGDCDILNGVTVLLLRKMNVPARLVIGAVGRQGEILPVLHAWTEYYDDAGRRQVVDASQHAPRLNPDRRVPADRQRLLPQSSDSAVGGSVLYLKWILAVLSGSILILLVVLFFLLSREPAGKQSLSDSEASLVERDLAGMALHALLHPNHGVWGRGILNFKLIPALNKRPISIKEALKLGQQQRLFTARRENPIVAFLESSNRSVSVPILDAGNLAFAPLLKLLPGVVHLDRLTDIKLIDPAQARASWLGQLSASVNRLTKAVKNLDMPMCFLVGGELDDDFLDVDLTALPTLPDWLIPNRFIAVNPHSRRFNAVAAIYPINPRTARFRFIDILLHESRLAPIPRQTARRRTALYLMLENQDPLVQERDADA